MIQFQEARDVRLRNVQTRMEKHGEDDVPAIDLAISVTGSNTLLDMIDPDLRASFFKALSEREGELSLPTDDLPSVRFPLLQMPIKFDREHVGMMVKIGHGISSKTDIVLSAVKLSKPRVAALIEGGSVELQFSLSTTDVNERTIGKLSLMQSHEISLTLTAPDVVDEPKDPGTDPAWPFPKEAGDDTGPTASDIFTAGAEAE